MEHTEVENNLICRRSADYGLMCGSCRNLLNGIGAAELFYKSAGFFK